MAIPYAEVIGDPIAHSKSPLIHSFWLEKIGFQGEFRPVRVAAEELPSYFASRRADPDWRGCNVTVPHKQAVIPLVDKLGPLAEQVGAVNVIFRIEDELWGGNSDVQGVLDAVEVEPGSIRTACLIGSGGAALAAVAAFRLLRVGHLLLNVRDQAKGKALLAKSGMGGRIGAIDDRTNLTGAQLIVNATTLGMDGQSPMPESVLTAISDVEDDRAIVLDMVYAPLDTELLQAARGRRLRAVDGLKMLVGQAASAFDTFFHVPPPRQFDGELRALLTS